MTCPSCGCELTPDDDDNPQELECGICNWSGHPVECYRPDEEQES